MEDDDIKTITSRILAQHSSSLNLVDSSSIEIVHSSDISTGSTPISPIIKMTKRGYLDDFFNHGSLKLGTFREYNQTEHEEIGDSGEGSYLFFGRNINKSICLQLAGGYDRLTFCCFHGNLDRSCIERFGYDAAFKINNPVAFSEAVYKSLKAERYTFAPCVYSKNKVFVATLPNNYKLKKISSQLIELGGDAKFFIKPTRYSHQQEFRFLWQMATDIKCSTIINCREAIQYCEKINIDSDLAPEKRTL